MNFYWGGLHEKRAVPTVDLETTSEFSFSREGKFRKTCAMIVTALNETPKIRRSGLGDTTFGAGQKSFQALKLPTQVSFYLLRVLGVKEVKEVKY
jgi:hypothetical protein